jgi:hypothetical protein
MGNHYDISFLNFTSFADGVDTDGEIVAIHRF